MHRLRHRPGALFAGDGLKGIGPALAGWNVEILATDISNEVLAKAKAGIYNQFEVQRGLPIQSLVKFFSQIGESWQIAPEIRGMVQFRPLNLLNDFSSLGSFDIVFCRNVLIYFDQDTKIGVLNRIGAPDAAGRLSDFGRRRNGGRPDRGVQADVRPARPLCAAHRGGETHARGQRAQVRDEGVGLFLRWAG